ncbi:hypothetical protein GF402_06775 [Candidatus Fermentibacteria bacterium]|nr:hypothetical protein [Candidatus Fermentibacteria bacterium]
MSGKNPRVWPRLVVLAGFLVADLLMEGAAAAIVVFGLGGVEFALLVLVQSERHYDVLAEGAALAAIVLIGDWLSGAGYEGAGFALMETVLGAVLAVSAGMEKPILDKQMRRMTGLSMGGRLAARASLAIGLVLVAHSLFLWMIILVRGSVGLIAGVAGFLPLYLLAVLWLRRRPVDTSSATRLVPRGEDEFLLVRDDRPLAKLRMSGQRVVDVVIDDLHEGASPDELLVHLEHSLARRGVRTLRLTSWGRDTLPLEMAGFTRIGDSWQKVIPIGRGKGGPG